MFDKYQLPDIAEREAAAELLRASNKATDALGEADDRPSTELSDEEYKKISDASDAAWNAYRDHPIDLDTDSDGAPLRCCISGAPLTVDDETMDDPETGEKVLRAAIGMPPRPVDDQLAMDLPDLEGATAR